MEASLQSTPETMMNPDETSISLDELLSHTGWIRGLARRLLEDPGVVEDVVQQTVVKALENPPRNREKLPAWLSTVLRNLALQQKRGDARRARRESRSQEIKSRPNPTPAELVTRLETQRILAEEVANLSEPYRATVLLHFYEGISLAEIGQREKLPAGTVRWRMKAALDELRDRMDRRSDGDRQAWSLPLLPLVESVGEISASSLEVKPSKAPPREPSSSMSPKPSSAFASFPVKVAVVVSLVGVTTGVLMLREKSEEAPQKNKTTSTLATSVPGQEKAGEGEPSGNPTPRESGTLTSQDASPQTDLTDLGPSLPEVREESSGTELLGSLLGRIADTLPKTQTATILARAVDAEGQPLSGIDVEFCGYGGVRFRGPLEVELPGSKGRTRADGTVRLDLVVPGRALLMMPERLRPKPGESIGLLFEFSSPSHRVQTKNIPVSDGETGDLGDVVLLPGGTILGTVTDAFGEAIENAEVCASVPLRGKLTPKNRAIGPPWGERRRGLQARTDHRGGFRIPGAQEGVSSVWTRIPGKPWVAVNVEVLPGEEALVSLRLEEDPAQPRDLVVWVRTPDGSPAAKAFVHVKSSEGGRGHSSQSTRADDEGRMIANITAADERLPQSYSVFAHDPNGEFGSTLVEGIESSRGEIVVALTEAKWFEVVAIDLDETPLPEFKATLKIGSPELSWGFDSEKGRGGGPPCRLRRPAAASFLEVSAPGYRSVTLGPLASVDFEGAPLSVRLTKLDQCLGQVLANGQPVPGARIEITPTLEPGRLLQINGFPCDLDRGERTVLTADSDGRFTFPFEKRGPYEIWASTENLAPTAQRIELRRDGQECVLHLGPGGSIEGSVLLPVGRDPSRLWIGYARGDGRLHKVRPDPEGRFRLENLTPGPWKLEEVNVDFTDETQTMPLDGTQIDFNCRVLQGETARWVLDLRFEER